MIEFVRGNFFDYSADIRVNTVNCVGVMGAGVALQFKKEFPEMFEEYVRECNLGNVKIGKPHVWIDNALFSTAPTIINLPTKDNWKKPSEYDYVEKGLIWLRQFLENNIGKTITVPALGCGHGGLDWGKVKPMIYGYLGDLDVKILVFEPSSSSTSELTHDELVKLASSGVGKVLPIDSEYPMQLRGRAATEIYTNGSQELLKKKILSIVIDPKSTDREKKAIISFIEAFPNDDDITFLLGYNSSFEIDIIKLGIERNFNIIAIIPYGLLNFKMRKDLQAVWIKEKHLIASVSNPRQAWSIGESVKSFKFRLKIPNVVLFTNYSLDFLKKMENDLKEIDTPIFYLNYWNEKPSIYKALNARKIGRERTSSLPNVAEIVDLTKV